MSESNAFLRNIRAQVFAVNTRDLSFQSQYDIFLARSVECRNNKTFTRLSARLLSENVLSAQVIYLGMRWRVKL